jgi:hypothetical protein
MDSSKSSSASMPRSTYESAMRSRTAYKDKVEINDEATSQEMINSKQHMQKRIKLHIIRIIWKRIEHEKGTYFCLLP